MVTVHKYSFLWKLIQTITFNLENTNYYKISMLISDSYISLNAPEFVKIGILEEKGLLVWLISIISWPSEPGF